jgi:hypothetical protein
LRVGYPGAFTSNAARCKYLTLALVGISITLASGFLRLSGSQRFLVVKKDNHAHDAERKQNGERQLGTEHPLAPCEAWT